MIEISIWGIKIHPLRKTEIRELVDNHLTYNNSLLQLTGVNPETIIQAQNNKELQKAINNSEIVNIDNMLVVFSLRLLGFKIPERAACPDIFEQLLTLSNRKGYSIFFLGAKEEVLKLMISKLNQKYSNLNVVGSHNGYYRSEEETTIVEEIRGLNPDMLFIALPTPQKELFIYHYKEKLGTRFAFGVGGAFDVQAEKVVRAPLWMRNIGLEGFHRALQNPSNYGSRYLKYYIPFIKLFFKELYNKRQ